MLRQAAACEICGRAPGRPHRNMPAEMSSLGAHEIANGPLRQIALDKPFALLVLCWRCNSTVVTNRRAWPESRQLAVLKRRRPGDYDLAAYNQMVNPRAPGRITEDEVEQWRA